MTISARYSSSHDCCTWWLNSPGNPVLEPHERRICDAAYKEGAKDELVVFGKPER